MIAQLSRLLESTPIGATLNWLGSTKIRIPYFVWRAASRTYALNASGTVIKVGQTEGRIWRTIEKPILTRRGIPIKVIP